MLFTKVNLKISVYITKLYSYIEFLSSILVESRTFLIYTQDINFSSILTF